MMKKAGPDPLAETPSSGRQRMVVVIQMPAAARTATTMPALARERSRLECKADENDLSGLCQGLDRGTFACRFGRRRARRRPGIALRIRRAGEVR